MREENRNKILITVDSMRSDSIRYMKNVKKLAEEASRFKRAYSNGPFTPFSFPSIFNLNYEPLTDPPRLQSPTIVEELKGKGYNTMAVVASNPYISSLVGYERGFNRYEDYLTGDSGVPRTISRWIDKGPSILTDMKNMWKWYFKDNITSAQGGMVAVEDALDDIEQSTEPFFLWLHLMDTHYPYTPPRKRTEFSIRKIIQLNRFRKEYRLKRPEDHDLLTRLKMLYRDCIRWTDECLGNFFSRLKEKEIWDETDIVLTADHGEGFYEHGFLGHPAQLYEEVVRIPLIIKHPGIERSKGLVELRDLSSFLAPSPPEHDLQLRKKTIPLRGAHAGGRSCMVGDVNLINRPDKLRYSIYGFVTEHYKFIYDEEDPTVELYDLKNDTEERDDISSSEENVVNKFKSRLENRTVN